MSSEIFTPSPDQNSGSTGALSAGNHDEFQERRKWSSCRKGDTSVAEPTRVAFFIPSFRGAGVERNTVLIASEMARRDVHVAIFAKEDIIGPNREFLHPDVKVSWISDGSLGGTPDGVGSVIRRATTLRRMLNEWKPDVVFARGSTCPWIASLAQFGISGRWKTVISIHNPLVPEYRDNPVWQYLRIMSRSAHAVFGVSKDIVNDLINVVGLPPSKCSTIYNPVDLEWITNQLAAPYPRNFVTNKPYILSIGRIDMKQKGFLDLIDAYALLERDISEDLVILGDGVESDLNILRRRIESHGLDNRVHLPGYIPNPFPILERARLFAQSSHFEGHPTVLLEALACGTPIVATDCPGGAKEIIEYGRLGELVSARNPRSLADGIRKSLSGPPRCEPGIIRAKEYSVDKVADKYLDIARSG